MYASASIAREKLKGPKKKKRTNKSNGFFPVKQESVEKCTLYNSSPWVGGVGGEGEGASNKKFISLLGSTSEGDH